MPIKTRVILVLAGALMLTTILAADVEGYSRFMSVDEVATLNTLG